MSFFGFLIDLDLAVTTSLKLQVKGRAGFLQNYKIKRLTYKTLLDSIEIEKAVLYKVFAKSKAWVVLPGDA